MNRKAHGFTIVELLIVIVVIGVLAAISVVAYSSIINQGYDATVKSDLSSASRQLEIIKVNLGRYPASMTADFSTNFKFTKSAYSTSVNNAMYCLNQETDEYALGVTSKSGKTYLLRRGVVQVGAAVDATSVCSTVGTTWATPRPVATTTVHGYHPSGSAATYTDGWNNTWTWTR
jgi:general secretion pathway protein G